MAPVLVPAGVRRCRSECVGFGLARACSRDPFGKGQMGSALSALMGSLQIPCFLTGTFWVLPLTYFYLPKSASAHLFPNLSKFITFAAAPLVLTPFVRNQPMRPLLVGSIPRREEHSLRSRARPRLLASRSQTGDRVADRPQALASRA